MPAAAAASSASASSATGPESEIRFSQDFKCSTCVQEFKDSREQREHMRGDWHIHNLRRKMEGLSPVDLRSYTHEIASSSTPRKRNGVEGTSEGELVSHDRSYGPTRQQLRHQELISNSEDETFEISDSSDSDPSDDVTSSDSDSDEEKHKGTVGEVMDDDELRLPSGKILGSKNTRTQRPRRKREPSQSQSQETTDALSHRPLTTDSLISNPPHTQSKQLATRNAAGLLGLSELQKSALVKEEKKMMSVEIRKKNAYQEGVDHAGNSQKHYRIGGSRGGKKMGGLEKRLG